MIRVATYNGFSTIRQEVIVRSSACCRPNRKHEKRIACHAVSQEALDFYEAWRERKPMTHAMRRYEGMRNAAMMSLLMGTPR